MATKKLPFTKEQIEQVIENHPTPFHLYDERAILDNARALRAAFHWNEGFREYFAVKATPNPYIMKMLKAEGFGADCSSAPELTLAERVGLSGEQIVFSSNDTPLSEYRRAKELGVIINLDDIGHIPFIEKHMGLPELICCRYNPGPLKEGNAIIGHPEDAKYGFTRDQIFEGYGTLRNKGVKRFGLHTMVASNELDPRYFVETAELLFQLVVDLSNELGIRFEFVNIGGGMGIPYKPEEEPVDLKFVSAGIEESYRRNIEANNMAPLALHMECGRIITGPYGYLVTTVLHIKRTYKRFVGVDASMANLMRPGMYGAYHHVSVLGKEDAPHNVVCDVTGSLCENCDRFAIDRSLPEIDSGDIVVIHDTGAHGHAMGFNYNAKLRSAELLMRQNGEVIQIRRAETEDDLFATLDFSGLDAFQL